MSKEYDEFIRLLTAAVPNVTQSFYDSYVEKNTSLRARAGVKCYIIRRQMGRCCDWCASLAGIYEEGDAPDGIYQRHKNCKCLVTFRSEKGTYTDVWSKREFETQRAARLEKEKYLVKSINENRTATRISSKNTAKGKASAVAILNEKLTIRQEKILSQLSGYDSRIEVDKEMLKIEDIAVFTAKTGDEFAVFTNGKKRLIIRGNNRSVNINLEKARELATKGYKWSGHSHPGHDLLCLTASDDDYEILKAFNQNKSVIYNSLGQYVLFGNE